MRLIDKVQDTPGRMAVPLAGYPGIQLTNSTIRQNEFNAELQTRSLYKLVERTRPDMVFTMMDLSIEAGSLGLPVRYPIDESATVEWHPVKSASDLERYKVIDPIYDGRIWVFLETVRSLVAKLDIPVGAYVIGPFTLAGLMMGANNIALATLDSPDVVHATVNFCERVVVDFGKALEDTGAYAVCVLDPTAMMLSPEAYWRFAGASLRNVIRHLDTRTILHICGNIAHLIEPMCETGVQGISLDSMVDMPQIAKQVPSDVVLMGNIDPVGTMLHGTPEKVRQDTIALMEAVSDYRNIIISTGCDLPAETPIENIEQFVRTVKQVG